MKLTVAGSNSTNTRGLCALVTHEAESTTMLMNREERILDVESEND